MFLRRLRRDTPLNDTDESDYDFQSDGPDECIASGGVYQSDPDTTFTVYVNGSPGSCTGNCEEDPLQALYDQDQALYYSRLAGISLTDEQRLQLFVQDVAQQTAGFPDVCSGEVFCYAGVNIPVGKAHGFVGFIGNYDSKAGKTIGGLAEGSGHSAGGAGAYSKKGGPEGLVFVPFAEAGGAVVGISKQGLAVGGYGGIPEKWRAGAGGGAYFNISTIGACSHP